MSAELIAILRMFVYRDPPRSDRWIRDRSLYAALMDWARDTALREKP